MINFKPAQELPPLINQYGIEGTWKLLLLRLINSTKPSMVEQLLAEPEYSDEDIASFIKVPNLLENLSIGEISVLYEYSLAYNNHESRKSNGQYFTPDDVAELMAKFAMKLPQNAVWLDPCCGVGNLSYWLVASQSNPEEFLVSHMKFNDLDSLALLICRTLMTLWFQNKYENLFTKLSPNYTNKDFLDAGFSDEVIYNHVLLNPPYANTEKKEEFETANIHDLWAYFLEKCVKTAQGFVSITPQTFTNAAKYNTLRRLLLTGKRLNVYCFDNIPDAIFHGYKFGSQNTNTANSVRASIIVWEKGVQLSVNIDPRWNLVNRNHSITPLLRWTRKNREKLLHNLKEFENPLPVFTEKSFPKNWRETAGLYERLSRPNQIVLSDWLSKEPTKWILYVPSTPRYFITATKRKLSRSSFHTLYFANEAQQNLAYILLNSSLTYWWWRLFDGGMTLSIATLYSLPIPDGLLSLPKDKIEERLDKLKTSEKENLVIKANAGKDNENVKHSHKLIRKLTKWLVDPATAEFLSYIHTNNDLLYTDLG